MTKELLGGPACPTSPWDLENHSVLLQRPRGWNRSRHLRAVCGLGGQASGGADVWVCVVTSAAALLSRPGCVKDLDVFKYKDGSGVIPRVDLR